MCWGPRQASPASLTSRTPLAVVVLLAPAATGTSRTWFSSGAHCTTWLFFFFFFCKLLSAERPRPSAPGSPAAQPLLPRSPVGVPFQTTLEELVAAAHGTRGAARLAAAQVGRSARRVGRGSEGGAARGKGAGGRVWVVPT